MRPYCVRLHAVSSMRPTHDAVDGTLVMEVTTATMTRTTMSMMVTRLD